ncbi:MAG: GDP-mannose 4,6-dehydratase [Deltaproteobacteria bacterium]|nr:GDP-mannose 4,6-dehydratase [Deltaproteobacteria bacterium]
MNILVTGSSGFIASSVVKNLLNCGNNVHGIDDHNDYYDPELKKYRANLNIALGLAFHKESILNKEFLRKLFRDSKFDSVLHLAAMAGVRYSQQRPELYIDTNVTGTLNILELCKEFGVKKYALASTSSLYAGEPLPYVETLAVNNPWSPYAASKKSAEVLSYSYQHLYQIDVSILRFFTVFGPAGRPDMSIYRFIDGALNGEEVEVYGDGSQARDFTFIEDIAEGVCRSVKLSGYNIINLGGGKNPKTILDLISTIELKTGKKMMVKFKPFIDSDMKVTWADITKAKTLMNWYPKESFESGIEKTIDWHENNSEFIAKLKNIKR